jgi:hypothetical protein
MSIGFIAVGEYGASHGAKIAQSVQKITMTAPTVAMGDCAAVNDPWKLARDMAALIMSINYLHEVLD